MLPPWGGPKRDKLLKDFVCRCFNPADDGHRNKVTCINDDDDDDDDDDDVLYWEHFIHWGTLYPLGSTLSIGEHFIHWGTLYPLRNMLSFGENRWNILGKALCLVQAQTEEPAVAEELKGLRLAHRGRNGQCVEVAKDIWQTILLGIDRLRFMCLPRFCHTHIFIWGCFSCTDSGIRSMGQSATAQSARWQRLWAQHACSNMHAPSYVFHCFSIYVSLSLSLSLCLFLFVSPCFPLSTYDCV